MGDFQIKIQPKNYDAIIIGSGAGGGLNDIGYMGNQPNQWNGVPDDVLKQYNLAYTDKEIKECISF